MSSLLDSDTVANYLANTPHFFEEHAELLGRIKLTSPVMGRAISLQERQMEILREKIKVQELHYAEMGRNAHSNDGISDKLHLWSRSLLLANNDADLPTTLIAGLHSIFSVPQATLRLWDVAAAYADTWFAASVSADARLFTNGLQLPFCGSNNDFEAASWLERPTETTSIAMLPLRLAPGTSAFGLLVLSSPDAERFSADMATDFLSKIADTASAALSHLLA